MPAGVSEKPFCFHSTYFFFLYRTMVKQFENEREKFLILKETADKKEIDLEKEISELRVQMIEMRDTSVSELIVCIFLA